MRRGPSLQPACKLAMPTGPRSTVGRNLGGRLHDLTEIGPVEVHAIPALGGIVHGFEEASSVYANNLIAIEASLHERIEHGSEG